MSERIKFIGSVQHPLLHQQSPLPVPLVVEAEHLRFGRVGQAGLVEEGQPKQKPCNPSELWRAVTVFPEGSIPFLEVCPRSQEGKHNSCV